MLPVPMPYDPFTICVMLVVFNSLGPESFIALRATIRLGETRVCLLSLEIEDANPSKGRLPSLDRVY